LPPARMKDFRFRLKSSDSIHAFRALEKLQLMRAPRERIPHRRWL